MQNREHGDINWDAHHTSALCRPQHRRQGRYISPYHESPIDLDKYEDDLNTTETTDKSNTKHSGDGGWPAEYGQGKISLAKGKDRTGKTPSRPLATGCAANFEIFGRGGPSEAAFFD